MCGDFNAPEIWVRPPRPMFTVISTPFSLVQAFPVLRVFDLREFQFYAIFFCSINVSLYAILAYQEVGKCPELEEIWAEHFRKSYFCTWMIGVPKGHSFFRGSFLILSSETIPKGTLYTWRGSTDASFGAKMKLKVYITRPRGFLESVKVFARA